MKNNRSRGVVVGRSRIHGKGIFAKRNFVPGEVVVSWRNCRLAELVNHSCAPTCRAVESKKYLAQEDVIVAGVRGLRRGEEATYNYRQTRWRSFWLDNIKGNCACTKCRPARDRRK